MGKVLISIKPEYVNEILAGRKKYEYRKVKAKKDNIDKMLIYATAPIKKVVAEAEILNILADVPDLIWEHTKEYSGISKSLYDKYYENSDIAIAYQLGKIKKYDQPENLSELGVLHSPQSFIYID